MVVKLSIHLFFFIINKSCDGPKLSHLAYADDLILFGEASVTQARNIKDILDTFCKSSAQKVSSEKTEIFFSRNVGWHVRKEVSEICGFGWTDNLGKYLGVPILPNGASRATFQFIMDKVGQRLSNWKAENLSFAGRVTLAKSFIWGDTEENKKMHLISWDKICAPKKEGGLRMRHAHNVNSAFMMCAGWNLCSKPESLWVSVIRSKYKCGPDLMPIISKERKGSNLWNEWGRHDLFDDLFPLSVQQKIKGIIPPCNCMGIDTLAWGCTSDGRFNTKSAYLTTHVSTVHPNQSLFNLIWKWKGPERVKLFLWKASHACLMTNLERFRRRMTDSNCVLGLAGWGGVIRNCHGGFIVVFSAKVGSGSVVHAELWGIVYGLELANNRGYKRIRVESDSLIAINLIRNG
ncbi:hypothetical protein TSUD_185780 [Trifolium subterraneum]|uniref:RNase H type-1 domain-containing protein n=1 Tax=Trifolium subterraneum TaxID=3900 RepID=A0A2Z6P0Y1_TRISU|nr:hypothetical protein TSUD_185780 [Trifolium subterraneum]